MSARWREAQGLDDPDAAFEIAEAYCTEAVRTFLLLAAQNADVRLRTDAERLNELQRGGLDRRVGRVWGRNDCCADSLLQLLIVHGILPEDISEPERDAACEANRFALVHGVGENRPRDLRGRDDPSAFLEHDRHAEPTVEFFMRWFNQRLLRELPDEGIELTVYSRVDSPTLPPATRRICRRAGDGRDGLPLQVHLFNTTGSGISGFHYDPLVRR